MPQYRKKPAVIEAVPLVAGVSMPDGVLVRATTEAPNAYEVFNPLHDSWIKCKEGDMIRVDLAPRDVYPIDRRTFDETYEPAGAANADPVHVRDVEALGRAAFESYNKERGGLTHDGKPTPPWDALGTGVQAGWIAAGHAAASQALVAAGVSLNAAQNGPVAETRSFRHALDAVLQRIKGSVRTSRSRSLAVTHLEDAILRLGMDLKELREAGHDAGADPYPDSYDPTSTAPVAPTADGLRL